MSRLNKNEHKKYLFIENRVRSLRKIIKEYSNDCIWYGFSSEEEFKRELLKELAKNLLEGSEVK